MKQLQRSFVILGAVLCVMLSGNNVFAQGNAYKIDEVHSSVGFAIRHLMISTTRGEFTDYTGEIQFDPQDLSFFSVNIVIGAKKH